MKTKTNYLALFALIFTIGLNAQNYDQRLLQVYSAERLQQIEQNAPGSIDYLNFYVRNSYQFIERPEGKEIETKELRFVNIQTGAEMSFDLTEADLRNFNPMLFNCRPGENHTYYSIGSSNKILMMLSQKEIERRYKLHIEQQKL
ncbi:MAG: hypothetical protein JXR60_11085 [Bacteroidales bacterium]|nr:hypothetical protein [Bacteroidales bacterium]